MFAPFERQPYYFNMSTVRWFFFLTLAFSTAAGQEGGQPENDPHRPPCTSTQCRKIRSFLRTHYCGESPFGNGPHDGCDTRGAKESERNTVVTADYGCPWDESAKASKCRQEGNPTGEDRKLVLHQMRLVGLPKGAEPEVYFKVLKSASGLSVMKGSYEHLRGLELTFCEVIVVADAGGGVHVLRKVPLQKAENVDTADSTSWSPVDIADVVGDGHLEIVLEANAYEDHWLEVVSVQGGSFKTIFSGLCYYL
jgi:hypothetical protein